MDKQTNFITPPDFVDENEHTILIIDADPIDVETLSFLCASHNKSFDVYLYKESMDNLAWLVQAEAKSDTIIVNTVENGISAVKETYAVKENAYHYGAKTLSTNRKIDSILAYFATLDQPTS